MIKNLNLSIDDLVIPKTLSIKGLEEKIEIPLNQKFLENNEFVFTNNITTFHDLSMNSSLPLANDYDTIEMESFVLALSAVKNKSSFYIGHYIMDKPKEGLGLGRTYYSRKFLLNLFSKEIRGKDKALNYVSRQLEII